MMKPQAMPAGRQISIIIVNYNTVKEIERCLYSVHSSQSTAHSLEIIVVDNASTDNSVEIIKTLPQVKLIHNQKNLGFAKGNNIGARLATGDFLFFLNPDTQVKKDTISNLLEFSKKNLNAIVGPKILNPDGSIQGSCYNLPTILGAIREYWLGKAGAYEKFAPIDNKPVKVEAIVGAAIFMSKKVFDKIGGFDERYFLYYEDLDFCRRAAKLNIPIYYYPQVVVIHSLGRAGGNIEQLVKSSKTFNGFFKHFLINLIIRLAQKLKLSEN